MSITCFLASSRWLRWYHFYGLFFHRAWCEKHNLECLKGGNSILLFCILPLISLELSLQMLPWRILWVVNVCVGQMDLLPDSSWLPKSAFSITPSIFTSAVVTVRGISAHCFCRRKEVLEGFHRSQPLSESQMSWWRGKWWGDEVRPWNSVLSWGSLHISSSSMLSPRIVNPRLLVEGRCQLCAVKGNCSHAYWAWVLGEAGLKSVSSTSSRPHGSVWQGKQVHMPFLCSPTCSVELTQNKTKFWLKILLPRREY